jgi:N-acetylneuraminic acid mutarotase
LFFFGTKAPKTVMVENGLNQAIFGTFFLEIKLKLKPKPKPKKLEKTMVVIVWF